MKVIASSRPIKHGNRAISKSLESLNKLLSLDSLPIVDEHNGSVIGQVSNFVLRVKNGITEVLADIPKTIQTANKGFSLQFSSKLVDDVFHIDKFHHLALTSNPRDVLTFSESDNTEVNVEEPTETPIDGDKEEEQTEVKSELTSEQLLLMLDNPEVQKRLLGLLNVQAEVEKEVTTDPEKSTTADPEPIKETEQPKPIRVVIKPNTPPIEVTPKPKTQMKVKQLQFPGL